MHTQDLRPAEPSAKREKHEYASKDFWNSRFNEEEKYDWYIGWPELKPYFLQLGLTTDAPILNVGCGNSSVAVDMWNDGLKNLWNIDISDKVIDNMKKQVGNSGVGGQWLEMDATNMTSFADNSFQAVIDKGTLDALVCADEKSIPINLVKEMFRVCRPGGVVMIISHSSPEARREFLECCLPKDRCVLRYCQQSLSQQVNMVNIMRAVGGARSLGEVMRTPELLMQVIKEVKEDQQNPKLGGDWREYSFYQAPVAHLQPINMHPQPIQVQQHVPNPQVPQPPAEIRVPRQNFCFIYQIRKL